MVICEKPDHGRFEMIYETPPSNLLLTSNFQKMLLFFWFLPMFIIMPLVFLMSNPWPSVWRLVKIYWPYFLPLFPLILFFIQFWRKEEIVRKRERQTFNITQYSSSDYPFIRLNDEQIIYKRYGEQHLIEWSSIEALETNPGRTILYTNDGRQYPIPSYQLIEKLYSNLPMVKKVVECAGLIKDEKRSNYWIKRDA